MARLPQLTAGAGREELGMLGGGGVGSKAEGRARRGGAGAVLHLDGFRRCRYYAAQVFRVKIKPGEANDRG